MNIKKKKKNRLRFHEKSLRNCVHARRINASKHRKLTRRKENGWQTLLNWRAIDLARVNAKRAAVAAMVDVRASVLAISRFHGTVPTSAELLSMGLWIPLSLLDRAQR